MKNKNKKQTRTVKHNHPGRPKYTLRFPTRKEFTFQDILECNGVETNAKSAKFGKGKDCSLLTIRKGLKRDMYRVHPKTGKILGVNPRCALMSRPRLLLLDEPSLGLAPLIARQI